MKDNIEDTWIYEMRQEFHKLNAHGEDFDWERTGCHDDFAEFLITKVAEHKVPVHIEYYKGKETTHPKYWKIDIKSYWTEYDRWILRFETSKKSAKRWCKEQGFTQ